MAKLSIVSLLGLVLLSALSQGSVLPDATDNYNDNALSSKPLDNVDADWKGWGFSDSNDVVVAVAEGEDDEDDDMLTEDEDDMGEPVEIPLNELDDESLLMYLDLEDNILLNEADEHVAFELIKEQNSLYTGQQKQGSQLRRKRIAPLVARAAFAVGRQVFRHFARRPSTISGTRVTRHYGRSGNYQDALRDFNRLRPSNVKPINGRFSGYTGNLGNHRITVRSGSKGPNPKPTVEIRSHGKDLVRKFRYE